MNKVSSNLSGAATENFINSLKNGKKVKLENLTKLNPVFRKEYVNKIMADNLMMNNFI